MFYIFMYFFMFLKPHILNYFSFKFLFDANMPKKSHSKGLTRVQIFRKKKLSMVEQREFKQGKGHPTKRY